jgi:hypothetical protein
MSIAGLLNESKYSHNKYRAGDISTDAPYTLLSSETTRDTIILPLPTNFSSATGMDWQQEEVGILKSQIMHNKNKMADIEAMSYKDIFNNIGITGTLEKGWGAAKEDLKKIRARTKSVSKMGGAKVAKNPTVEMLFKGMQFKSYSFNFVLVPLRESDSDDIQKVIRVIQKASAPEMIGLDMFMAYPETWFINFIGPGGNYEGNEYLMKINECCCTNIGINYTPQGDSSNMHKNNAPLAVELTLDFTEIFVPSKESIEKFNG